VVTGQGADLTRPAAASEDATVLEIDTPHGPARAHVHRGAEPSLAVVLGHGAGGGIGARDLQAASTAALAEGASVALVEQPYRVAGRRSPAPARHLDAAWIVVVEQLPFAGLPLVAGGRSSGARVACRTAAATGAVGVLCLAFPLQPPRAPATSRLPELEAVRAPVLVVQGERDPFGMPPEAPGREVVRIPGDHSLRSAVEQVRVAVDDWLRRVL
jgi:predicted alpha/beta-hydrolase family hydrolase